MSMPARGRSGVVLAVVLLVIALGALSALAALMFASSQREASGGAARRAQSRALAWSGVQAVLEEVASQRGDLLRGGRPRVERVREVYGPRTGPGERGVCRLVSVGGSDEGAAVWMTAEGARLDLNVASTEALSRAGLGPGLAAEIAGVRQGRVIGSVAEVMHLPGWAGVEDRRAAERVTVFSFDPGECGVGARAGRARVDLSAGWTPQTERAARALLGRETAEALGRVAGAARPEGGAARAGSGGAGGPGGGASPPASLADLLGRLLGAGMEITAALEVVDACAVGGTGAGRSGALRRGVVSVYEAPAEVLRAAPGLDEEAARRIVAAREQVQGSERESLAWLVERGVLTVEQMRASVDGLTTRCLQWRVVMECGVAASGAGEGDEQPALRDRVVVEAVLDVSGETPRVAYLRDVTNLGAARWLDAWKQSGAGERPEPVAAGSEPGSAADGGASGADDGGGEATMPERAPASSAAGSRAPRGGPTGRVGRWTTGGGR